MRLIFGVLVGVAVLSICGWAYTDWQTGVLERRYPPEGHFVDVGQGARLHYTERKPVGVARAVVLLLHGASGNQADVMLPLGDRLAAAGFRVLAFDRPGHGWSDRPDGHGDASPARQAVLIRRGLDRLGVGHAIVLGHSWSGALAADFALDHADLTQGLVLVSPVLYPWSGGVAWYYGPAVSTWFGPLFTHVLTLPIGQVLMPAGVAEVFAPQPAPQGFVDKTGVSLVLRPAEFEDNADDVGQLHDFVTLQGPRMPGIAVPTAIVAGSGDRIVSPSIHAEHAARDIAGSTLTVLPGRGHSPHWTDPDVVVAAVESVAVRMKRSVSATAP